MRLWIVFNDTVTLSNFKVKNISIGRMIETNDDRLYLYRWIEAESYHKTIHIALVDVMLNIAHVNEPSSNYTMSRQKASHQWISCAPMISLIAQRMSGNGSARENTIGKARRWIGIKRAYHCWSNIHSLRSTVFSVLSIHLDVAE